MKAFILSLLLAVFVLVLLNAVKTHQVRAAFNVPVLTDAPSRALNEVPGLSPDYLRGKHDVFLFRCGRYTPKLIIDRITDGTNSIHVYRSPCWSI